MRPALACCLGTVIVLLVGGAYVSLLGEITSKCGGRQGLMAASAAMPKNPKSPSTLQSKSATSTNASVQPLFCSEVLQGPLAKSDPNVGVIYGKKTTADPSFTIALHNKTIDHTRWAIMTYGFYYERFITERAAEIMGPTSNTTPGIFLDVGMNIGWFSLLAAALGRDVVAFEPNPINYFRMCQSVGLNGWSSPGGFDDASRKNLRIFPFGVGAKPTHLTLVQPLNNPGGSSFHGDEAPVSSIDGASINDIRVVTLDDVAKELRWYDEPKTQIAILKVDVEGYDPEVFEGAEELLSSGLVKNIFMEYSFESGANAKERLGNMIRRIVTCGYKVCAVGNWNGAKLLHETAYAQHAEKKGADQLAEALHHMVSVKKVGSRQYNLEWTRR